MRWWVTMSAIGTLSILGIGGCQPAVITPPTQPAAEVVLADEDHLAWAESEPIFVVVRQSCRTLDVYRRGRRIRTYSAVFGLGGKPKLYEGDRRTPVGFYRVSGKRPHPRWQYFLLLDYPDQGDVLEYDVALRRGDIPTNGKGHLGHGSDVGIHGTDKPDLNRRGVDWTFGCISVEPQAAYDLARLLPVGTPVLITE
jgi:murein L,D-transpeptidase YafK